MAANDGQRAVHDGPIASPCVRICVVHPEARICVGCHRTLDEIAGWTRMTEAERAAVLAALPGRIGLLRRRRGGRAGRLAAGPQDAS